MNLDRESAPRLFSWSALLRRGWIVPVVAAMAALAAYIVASERPVHYTSQSVVAVNSGAGVKGPGHANEAIALARIYARAIPDDQRIRAAVANSSGRPPDDVAKDITVTNDAGTSLLRLQYRDDDAGHALAGARSLRHAVVFPNTDSAIAPGSVTNVRVASTSNRVGGTSGNAVPIGIVIGLALGVLLMVGWERRDRRLDDEEALRTAFAGGVSDVRAVTPGTLSALLGRWRSLADGDDDARIALVAASRRSRRAAERLAERFGGEREGVTAAGAPGSRDSGEETAVRSDLVALVVARGTPARDVRRAADTLAQFDREPRWALLARGRGPRLRGSMHGAWNRSAADDAPTARRRTESDREHTSHRR